MAAAYSSTQTNMVNQTNSIIEGYSRGGPIRALAQEPPQNSLDAKAPDAVGPVSVDYRLHRRELPSGDTMYMLTITDRNTFGLRGIALTPEDLEERAKTSGILGPKEDENWAKWEAMGYAKMGVNDRGSRGQGKAAGLFHSRYRSGYKDAIGNDVEYMGMLYDTLLPDGTYRLGARWAHPADEVRRPPFDGDEAREILKGCFTEWNGTVIPLNIEPLTSVGTRVILPHLSTQAVEAIHNGELIAWLQRLWWRSIQVGDLQITVTDETGASRNVEVPDWWQDQPWSARTLPAGVFVETIVEVPGEPDLKIKRIVLKYDPSISVNDFPEYDAQFGGVQLFRAGQWIETKGTKRDFTDDIPADKRPGFVGFVEFDRKLDEELRAMESPQHDRFSRQFYVVKQIDILVENAVRGFAERMGWAKTRKKSPSQDTNAERMLRRVTDLFMSSKLPGAKPKPSTQTWTARLDLQYPQRGTLRVDYGQQLRSIEVTCAKDPAEPRCDVNIKLVLVRPDASRMVIGERTLRTDDRGKVFATFPDIEVVKAAPRTKSQVAFPDDGKYRLVAECWVDKARVEQAVRHIYLRVAPPARPLREIAVDISCINTTSDGPRIDNGDRITIGITITNRAADQRTVTVDASFESLLLADGTQVTIDGRPPGDAPDRHMLSYPNVAVFTEMPQQPTEGRYVVLPPGEHRIRADVRDADGQVVAHASKVVYIQVDPPGVAGGPPFEVKRREQDGFFPLWEMNAGNPLYTLLYYEGHPAYQAALAAENGRADGSELRGTEYFWAELYCEAYLDWAVQLFQGGNENGLKMLSERATIDGDDLRQRYQDKLQELTANADLTTELRRRREAVALMLYIIGREAL